MSRVNVNLKHNVVTNISTPTSFHLAQAIRAIKNEIRTAPPFHARNNERRAEIDQLEDMLARRT